MIEIRPATPADDLRLVQLAQRDAALVPGGPMLIAIQDGEIRAALSLVSGASIADPFVPTAQLVAALRAYAAPPQRARRARRRRLVSSEARLAG